MQVMREARVWVSARGAETHSMMAAAAGPNTSNFAQSSAFADAVQRARQVFIPRVPPARCECGVRGADRSGGGSNGAT
ncbi:hypothetical protein E2C01_099417 [Portunus trituberculatus]|uniref:Uncharacterized protein n=1 Tax=Portunus trituberculatus TaxID=210409 RepID=A0A5B7KAQ9_PORTR|nr:hypothetical protein [Portunus trituberculatus]